MADVDTKEVEEKLEEPVEIDRFESEPEPVDEDEVLDGPTNEQVAAMQAAIDEENRSEPEEVEQAEPEKKEEAKLPETDKVEGTEKKPDLDETPPKEPDETEISKPDSETEEQPAVAETDFKPIKVEYVANREKKEMEINTVQDLQKLCSKADGLSQKLNDTHTELQAVKTERDQSDEKSRKTVAAYRRKEHVDKELEPYFDIFRQHPEMRKAFENDPRWGPYLESKGVKGSAVGYDVERAGHDYDVTEREAAVEARETEDVQTSLLERFADKYDPGGDILVDVVQHAISHGAFKPDGVKRTPAELQDHLFEGLKNSYGQLVIEGKAKTPAVKTSEDAKAAAEREVDQLKKINADHRSAPGSPGATQTPTKPAFELVDGEDTEDRNQRWLEQNPEAAAELNQGF